VTVAIDRRNENGLLSQSIVGNATDAQSILTTIATVVVTLTSIVLTVTLVAVQLAMGQLSPRIVRALLDDRGDQFAIAVFAATFTFSFFSLRAIETARVRRDPARRGRLPPGDTTTRGLKTMAPPERHRALDRQLRLLAGGAPPSSPTSRASARARTSRSVSRATRLDLAGADEFSVRCRSLLRSGP
jgi:Predicted membrane protein (DUF2254)